MKSIVKQSLALVALLGSTVSMAASVNVVSSAQNAVTLGDGQFTVQVQAVAFPSTAGATLGLTWNASAVDVVSIVNSPDAPLGTSVVAAAPWNPITFIGPLSGAQPSGNFNSFLMTFSVVGTGNANIQLIDDQADLCWTDALTSLCIADVSYNYTHPVVPVPAAAWLLVSGLGSLVGLKRLRKA